ncbi:MAG: OmpA family protein, partial [Sulfuricurvum sp.]|nr:OmpA family protein [Sulfuricurvum sp.]
CDRAIDAIKKQLLDHNVQESNIVTECREGSQPLYLENDKDARARNYRVMVALYVPKAEKPAPKAVPVAKPAPVVVPAPAELDSDGDGVVDSKDKCPNTPKGYKVDDNGCPREVTLHINFGTNLFAIPSSAYKDIDELKRFMNDYPMYNIEIIGHTDSVGSEHSNQILSEKRAKSLETLLVKEGIAADRMSSTGMGETKPIASNDDEAGRAQNRRTEVRLYVNSGK